MAAKKKKKSKKKVSKKAAKPAKKTASKKKGAKKKKKKTSSKKKTAKAQPTTSMPKPVAPSKPAEAHKYAGEDYGHVTESKIKPKSTRAAKVGYSEEPAAGAGAGGSGADGGGAAASDSDGDGDGDGDDDDDDDDDGYRGENGANGQRAAKHPVSLREMKKVAHEGLRSDGEILHVEENELAPCRLVDHGEGRYSLCFDDFRMPTVPLFDERGLQGGGYTWEAVAESLVKMRRPELMSDLSFDSEAGMFVALGGRETLRIVAKLIQEAIAQPAVLQDAVNRADPDRLE